MADTPNVDRLTVGQASFASASFENVNWKNAPQAPEKTGSHGETLSEASTTAFIEQLAKEIAQKIAATELRVAGGGGGGGGGGEKGSGGGGGSGGSESGSGILASSAAASKAQSQVGVAMGDAVRHIDAFSKSMAEAKQRLKDVIDSNFSPAAYIVTFTELRNTLIGGILASFTQPMKNFGADLLSGKMAVDAFTDAIREGTEAWKMGIGSILDWFKNILNYGSDYGESLRSIKENPQMFTASGLSVSEYGKLLSRMTNSLDKMTKGQSVQIMSTQEQHDLLVQNYKQALRYGYGTEQASSVAIEMAAKQTNYMEAVMRNTGVSASELIKSNEKPLTIDDAVFRGFLDKDQAIQAKAVSQALKAEGLGDLASTFEDALAKYGYEGAMAMLQKDPKFAFGRFPLVQEMVETLKNGGFAGGGEKMMKRLAEILSRNYENSKNNMHGLPQQLSDPEMALLRYFGDKDSPIREQPDRTIEGIMGHIANWLNDNAHVVAWLKLIGAMLAALTIANTKLGMSVLTFAKNFLTGGASVEGAGGIIGSIGGAIAWIAKLSVYIGALGVAISSVMSALDQTDEEIKAWGSGITGFLSQAVADMGPIIAGGLVAAVAAFFGAPALLLGAIGTGVYAAIDAMLGGQLKRFIGDFTSWASTKVNDFVSWLWSKKTSWHDVFKAVWDNLSGATTWALKQAGNLIDFLGKALTGIAEFVTDLVASTKGGGSVHKDSWWDWAWSSDKQQPKAVPQKLPPNDARASYVDPELTKTLSETASAPLTGNPAVDTLKEVQRMHRLMETGLKAVYAQLFELKKIGGHLNESGVPQAG